MLKDNMYRQLITECEKMMLECGFTLPTISYGFNNRKSSLGICKRRYGKITIELSKPYYEARVLHNDIKGIKHTLLHEMCHAMPNGMQHGNGWKHYVAIVNRKHGFNIKRLSEKSESTEMVKDTKEVNYKFVCKDCGQVVSRTKMSKFVQNYKLYSCGICKGGFERVL